MPIDSSGEVRETVEEIRDLIEADLSDGMQGWVTGPAGFTSDLTEGFLGIDGVFRFDRQGTNDRGLAIYEVTGSGSRIIAPAPPLLWMRFLLQSK